MADNGVHLDFDGLPFTPSDPPTENQQKPEVSELAGPDGLNLTPMGNAERFLRDYRLDVLWVEGSTINSSGTFYTWTDSSQRWQPDNAKAMLLAKETVSNLRKLPTLALAQGMPSDTVNALVGFWRRTETEHAVGEILNLAKWNVVIKQGLFDADPHPLGVKNGVVELRTGEVRPATHEDHIT